MTWFPGHMEKTRFLIRENIKLVDLVLEVTDARIPASSRNPQLDRLLGRSLRLVVMNKADLADPVAGGYWRQWFKDRGQAAVTCSSTSGQGIKDILHQTAELLRPLMEKMRQRGRKKRPVRLMIVGIPNVGKSSLLNRLAGRKRAATGATPGITRGKQWVSAGSEFELLDMPGILRPRLQDKDSLIKLTVTGAVPLESAPVAEAAFWLGDFLSRKAPSSLQARYNLKMIPQAPASLLADIGKSRGFLLPGGIPDEDKAARLLLQEFQRGKLGRFTLEMPGEMEEGSGEGRSNDSC